MSGPHAVVLYYHEIDPAGEPGGGVHELRVGPEKAFRPILERMLPNLGPEWNVTQGVVNWTDAAGHSANAIVELWPPKSPAVDELRLRVSRAEEVGGWNFDREACRAARERGERWFYVLELDSDDSLAARVLAEPALADEPEAAAALLRRRISAGGSGPVCAAIDLLRGTTAPDPA